MLYSHLMYNRGPIKIFQDAFLSSAGNPIFYYKFENDTTDSSGNGYDATISGTITYTQDDPTRGGEFSANVAGATSGSIPVNSIITGGNPFTLIGVVKVPANGFGNHILWMGGTDSGSSSIKEAFSMSFWGSGTSPQIAVDFARSWVSYSINPSLINTWMSVIVEYDSTNISVYVAPKGQSFSTIGTTPVTLNIVPGRNWLFAWGGDGSGGGSPIRFFIGACAFLGLKDAALSASDRDGFLIP